MWCDYTNETFVLRRYVAAWQGPYTETESLTIFEMFIICTDPLVKLSEKIFALLPQTGIALLGSLLTQQRLLHAQLTLLALHEVKLVPDTVAVELLSSSNPPPCNNKHHGRSEKE